MRRRAHFLLLLVTLSCGPTGKNPVAPDPGGDPKPTVELRDPREAHLADLRQLTFGGENAEAYWAFDGSELTMQSTRPPYGCDQIFRLSLDASEPQLISTGKGRTTCAHFYPGARRFVYSSTHLAGDECPPAPDHSKGYVWALYDSYEIFSAKLDGDELKQLTTSPGYDAEATVCGVDGSIVFTSVRDGDLELYRMDADGGNVVRLTNAPGYDGGAFFSADCSKLVWRASRPSTPEQLADYQGLLAQGLVRPTKLELWVANADGSEARQITYLDAASFAPFFFPNGERVIFSSNYPDARSREFDLWAVSVDGSGLERITYSGGFDGFPVFSPDGTMLAFSSNRNQGKPGDTNVFVAKWVDAPPQVEARIADWVMADVAWLADDAREGRGIGTAGLDAAADWLAKRFAEVGLEPGFGEAGYKQAFEVKVAVTAADATSVVLDGLPLLREQFTALGFSLSGEFEGDVVTAGYGITAPDLKIDDYKKVKAKGKVVVVRRFVPEGGKFEDDKLQRRYGDLRYKAWNAREHGARALIVVDLPEVKKGQELPAEAALPKLAIDTHGDAGIPVVVVTRAVGEPLWKGKHKALVRVVLATEKKPAWNIVGKIVAGAPDKLPGAVIIGAHYDHLGLGGLTSLAPDVTAPHNGADDNASGTAALLEVARRLAAHRAELKRDVWIVAFSGEEWGVLGSTAFTRSPPAGLALAEVVAMLNMDMVGRLRGNKLTVIGGESAEEWKELVPPACGRALVECSIGGDGYGPSDQTPFYASGIPVLHFFTGAHRDYHKPSDDSPLINAAGIAQVAAVVADVAMTVGARAAKLTLKAAPSAPAGPGDVRSSGASLGTVPDYAGAPDGRPGVLLAGVRPGSPAEQAGLRRGDLMVKIGDHEIRNIEDFMFVLRKSKPGEKAVVVVERDGKRVSVEVTFGTATRR